MIAVHLDPTLIVVGIGQTTFGRGIGDVDFSCDVGRQRKVIKHIGHSNISIGKRRNAMIRTASPDRTPPYIAMFVIRCRERILLHYGPGGAVVTLVSVIWIVVSRSPLVASNAWNAQVTGCDRSPLTSSSPVCSLTRGRSNVTLSPPVAALVSTSCTATPVSFSKIGEPVSASSSKNVKVPETLETPNKMSGGNCWPSTFGASLFMVKLMVAAVTRPT